MDHANNIGKYQLGRTIGEGTFAKVKVALNIETSLPVAIKIINKKCVMDDKLIEQVKREITAMKHLQHPNIVQIHEVIATKTKIYIVMEYVSGGQLSDKLSYLKRLSESEARKYFQQLVDAVDYCHSRGVYHRDLKPENLLLDSKENLKISDFGLSIWRKPGDLLSTACGSPSYVAPEVITDQTYDGSAADIWSCGVILFELLSGYLPFDDRSLMNLYRKISRAEYTCPERFLPSQVKLISKILDPLPRRRITAAEILEDEWMQIDYKPSIRTCHKKCIDFDEISATFDNKGRRRAETETEADSPHFINAFQLIAMSNDLDLSGLFEEEDNMQKTKLGSKHSIHETVEKIEVAAKDVRLSVERLNNSKVKLHEASKMMRCRSNLKLSAEVIELAPTHCVVEISKSEGELTVYKEFCKSLSSLLEEKSGGLKELYSPSAEVAADKKKVEKTEG